VAHITFQAIFKLLKLSVRLMCIVTEFQTKHKQHINVLLTLVTVVYLRCDINVLNFVVDGPPGMNFSVGPYIF